MEGRRPGNWVRRTESVLLLDRTLPPQPAGNTQYQRPPGMGMTTGPRGKRKNITCSKLWQMIDQCSRGVRSRGLFDGNKKG